MIGRCYVRSGYGIIKTMAMRSDYTVIKTMTVRTAGIGIIENKEAQEIRN